MATVLTSGHYRVIAVTCGRPMRPVDNRTYGDARGRLPGNGLATILEELVALRTRQTVLVPGA